MNKYESVIILSANASEEAMAAFGEKMKELISANGELTSVDEWGKKTFAYEIKKEKETPESLPALPGDIVLDHRAGRRIPVPGILWSQLRK